MAPQFGTDGVRGLANKELTPNVAMALGHAAVDVLLDGRAEKLVTIGRDTRKSGWMLQASVLAGAVSAGADVELLDVVPTPAVAWASAERSSLGVMISASHNPFPDNGVKLFAPGGLKLDDDVEATVQTRYLEILQGNHQDRPVPTGADIGTVVGSGGIGGWIDSVVGSVSEKLDFKIVVDGANGSAYSLGPHILRELGAQVVEIGADPNGSNINDGYGSTSPERLQKEVVAHQADMGIGFDGDADRLLAVDHHGTCVDGDRVLAILAADWKQNRQLSGDTVVVTVMTNLGFHRAMAEQGISVVTTGVGDRYVLEELDRGGFSLGGEQSGHIICRDVASTGDGILSAVQLLDAVRRSGKTLAEVASSAMTTVPQILRNVSLTNSDVDVAEALQGPVADVENTFGSEGRVLVRASGTEPLLRIMVEHLDETVAGQACTSLVDAAHKIMDTPPN